MEDHNLKFKTDDLVLNFDFKRNIRLMISKRLIIGKDKNQ